MAEAMPEGEWEQEVEPEPEEGEAEEQEEPMQQAPQAVDSTNLRQGPTGRTMSAAERAQTRKATPRKEGTASGLPWWVGYKGNKRPDGIVIQNLKWAERHIGPRDRNSVVIHLIEFTFTSEQSMVRAQLAKLRQYAEITDYGLEESRMEIPPTHDSNGSKRMDARAHMGSAREAGGTKAEKERAVQKTESTSSKRTDLVRQHKTEVRSERQQRRDK
jgi:hypothetical protein